MRKEVISFADVVHKDGRKVPGVVVMAVRHAYKGLRVAFLGVGSTGTSLPLVLWFYEDETTGDFFDNVGGHYRLETVQDDIRQVLEDLA